MNLLTDVWLDVKTCVQDQKKISVSEIGNATFVDLYAPRADFKGALYQLLSGLLQTTFAPADRKEWVKYWQQPPTAAELSAAFAEFEAAFNLDTVNGKPAFMQDWNLLPEDGIENKIASLLIEAPGDNTLKNNQDHFIKRGTVESISPYWAAIALFTLQINAPSGGQGHRVSLRGGGPLTTLVLPPDKPEYNTLWHRLWLNVLTQYEMFELQGNSGLEDKSAIFPWMAKTRTSENKGSETYPEHAHPLQMYWSMPRRIRLHWGATGGVCDISGEASDTLVRTYHTRNYGVNYAGSWTHPLTPYASETGKELYSIKAQPGGLGYRHWLELAAVNEDGNKKRAAALIVQKYRDGSRRSWIKGGFEARLWAFGYDMDNMKARCWYEATMPLYDIDPASYEDLQYIVKIMLKAATDTLHAVKGAIKIAWFANPKNDQNAKKFNEKAVDIDANFWSGTENQFYTLLEPLVAAVNMGDESVIQPILNQWRNALHNFAFRLFDDYAMTSANEDGDLKRVIKARHGKAGKTEKDKKSKQRKGDGLGYFLELALKDLKALGGTNE